MMQSKANLCLIAAGIAALLVISRATTVTEDDADLLKRAQELFRPLPKDLGTPDYPMTKERADLGHKLFFDARLTVDGNMSCASCHQPSFYGTDALPTSLGVRQRQHPRNAPTILNSGLNIIHWRGDRESLEDQVIKALTSPITSGQPDLKAVENRLNSIPSYAPLFKAAFPDDANPITARNVAKAISTYERTLVTPSPFDAYLKGQIDALSPSARSGLRKFVTTGCAMCHNGVGIGGGMFQKFGLVEDYWLATHSTAIDKGRFDVTKDPNDLYVFRVPSLRNVAKTAPYFHDGSVSTLPEAVKIMAQVQLGVTLNDAETDDIVTFLESLTGDLPANFVTAPNLPPGSVVRKLQ
jgi:cytochrome c peroxidase